MTKDQVMDIQYENCISIGWFCGTASSLAKIGLRSHTGPFDWYYSHYWAVLKQIETNFSDFMIRENLNIVDENKKIFCDTKYGFYFNHDVREDFDAEYHQIYERYMNRAKKFCLDILSPSVLFRTVRDQEEVEFINKNWKYAEELLKKFNKKNRIIYVKRTGLEGLTEEVESYTLQISQYVGRTYEMRHMFDSSGEIMKLSESLISADKIKKNIEYDKATNLQKATAAWVNKCVEENINGVDNYILTLLGVSREKGIYLWGAGKYGIPLAKYLRDRKVVVKGIIDNDASIKKVDEFDVITFDSVEDGAKIFISILNGETNKEIISQISSKHNYTKAIRFEDIYTEGLDV